MSCRIGCGGGCRRDARGGAKLAASKATAADPSDGTVVMDSRALKGKRTARTRGTIITRAMPRATRTLAERLTERAPGFTARRGERWTVLVDETPTAREAFAYSVARGLSDSPRWLSCRYLYDAAGSGLFLQITAQPEYYLTRAETEILEAQADVVRTLAGPVPLVELGAGAAIKSRHLLAAWARQAEGAAVEYVPLDIDAGVLTEAVQDLALAFPALQATALATSYERGLELLEQCSPLCVVLLGSTIGNFNAEETDGFLERLASALTAGDLLVLGIDLVKDPNVLEAAYNDAAGISHAFTRNLFVRMNRELGAGVPLEAIEHVAYWNAPRERIEIYARFTATVELALPAIGRSYRIAAGEMILTEISRKYRVETFEATLARFGFRLERALTDRGRRFALLAFRRIADAPGPSPRITYAALLQRVRRRTHDLLDLLTDEQLARPAAPILSPIGWDLGHIAAFEELWLIRTVDAIVGGGELPTGAPEVDAAPGEGLDPVYDAIQTPRVERAALPLPDRDALLRRLREVRQAALERLRTAPLDGGHPLLAGGYVYDLLAEHEAQHQETMLQAIALMPGLAYEPATRSDTPHPTLPPDARMVWIPGGAFPLGARGTRWFLYDNEQPQHWVDLAPFWMDTAPVSNGEFLAFLEDGGYGRREWWTPAGWSWRQREGITHPGGWRCAVGGWEETHFGQVEPLVLTRPVCHVSWYEAEAFARAAGKRLPTEAEWEKAAAWDPELRVKRRWPWGDQLPDPRRANLDAQTFLPAPVGAYPDGRSFYGCHQMAGDVWEWTASAFLPYQGFEPFPYREYSAVHFAHGHRVLRGGSWATAGSLARATFRNWDLPERRQLFAGFRCAEDRR
ncbi:MAG: ergothioneine biosynthesis protein EgtB [Gemmatimonadota bacterium]